MLKPVLVILSFLLSFRLQAQVAWPGADFSQKNVTEKSIQAWESSTFLFEISGTLEQLSRANVNSQQLVQAITHTMTYRMKLDDCVQGAVDLRENFCRKQVLIQALNYLNYKNYLDNVALLIVRVKMFGSRKQKAALKIDLTEHFYNAQSVERARLKSIFFKPGKPSKLEAKKYRVKNPTFGKITPREELYLKYNSIEIKFIGKILIEMDLLIRSAKIEIQADYDGDGKADRIIPVPAGEKRDLAFKVLALTLVEETRKEGRLPGKKVEPVHLLAAACELGLFDEATLDVMTQDPQFQNKKSQKGQIYLRSLINVGKIALLATPGGIYFILPVVVIESYFQGQKLKERKNAPTLF